MADDKLANDLEQRVLVVTPTQRDGEVTRAVLGQAGLDGTLCGSLAELCDQIANGVGAVLLTSESLKGGGMERLVRTIEEQPPWSDIPIILMQGGEPPAAFQNQINSLGNVTLLERPAPIRSVVSAAQTAVRARLRQYQIRDYDQRREDSLAKERSARAEAERVSHLKDEFLATLSHELRTPLNAIFGWAQLLKMDSSNPETVREGIEVIDRNVRMQTQLIEDLLDMSRIISGKVRLDVQSVDLPELISVAVESVRPAADGRSLRLEKVLDPSAGPVNGDPGRLQQVIWNLLTNAIKFTPKGGRVQVVLERVNSHVEIKVRDTGEGIDPDFLPYLFDRFSQADASTTRAHGGLGLGLSIVKNLVELHGGSIRAESEGEGKGSTFIVTLPIRATHPAHEQKTHPRGATSAPAFDCQDRLSGVKVLVVDDAPDAREVLRRFLAECGATAVTASSAEEAIRLLTEFRADVIVSDIGMPGRDGFDFIRTVRSGGNRTPAVALTAFARPEDRIRSIEAGFQTHLPKPVEPAELVAVVAGLAGRF